jgi:hypothetical protein
VTAQDSQPAAADSWQLSAQLRPGEPAAAAADPANETDVSPPAWQDAAEGVRTTVKWMVTAFAAIGAVMFAKGFVTTPRLSWETHTGRLLLAWALGIVGLLGIGWLIAQTVSMLRPTLYELTNLPEDFLAVVNTEPRKYLPSGCTSFDDYLSRFDHLRRSADSWRDTVAQYQRALDGRKAATPKEGDAIDTAQRDLEAATDAYSKTLRGLAVYKSVRQQLIDRAEYRRQSSALDLGTATMIAAALLAAAGGIGYQLLLAPDESSAAKDAPAVVPATPVIGELIRTKSRAGTQLWRQLRLAHCQADKASARIPVVVATGKGTLDDPYLVSTLPTRTCRAQTFSVINEVAAVSVPVKSTITVTPAATPGPH